MLAISMKAKWRSDAWASITRSAKEPGRWQLTWHDAAGPYGDTQRDTIGEAISEALRDGYTIFERACGPASELAAGLVAGELAKLEAARIAWERLDSEL
jgi:hypothetical protein